MKVFCFSWTSLLLLVANKEWSFLFIPPAIQCCSSAGGFIWRGGVGSLDVISRIWYLPIFWLRFEVPNSYLKSAGTACPMRHGSIKLFRFANDDQVKKGKGEAFRQWCAVDHEGRLWRSHHIYLMQHLNDDVVETYLLNLIFLIYQLETSKTQLINLVWKTHGTILVRTICDIHNLITFFHVLQCWVLSFRRMRHNIYDTDDDPFDRR